MASLIKQEVVDNLTTDNHDVALSAAQGKKLNDYFSYHASNYCGIGHSDSGGVIIAINPSTNMLALNDGGSLYYFRLTPM